MKRETFDQVFKDRQIKGTGGVFKIPETEVVALLLGKGHVSAVGGVVKLTLKSGFIKAESKKGISTYLEYDLVRAISFESKEATDRLAGFV